MADTTIDLLKNSSYVSKMDDLIAAVKLGGSATSDVEWDNVKNKPTTIGGYGIIDAKIDNGTITLGNQTITPLTSAPVTSVNSKTGAVTLSAADVSAIPSTLTGTAGQVLTKTADGQEWEDVDIPTALPNPNALTFTGSVTGTYDGSAPLTVNIPEGGGGGGSSGWSSEWKVLATTTLSEDVANVYFDFDSPVQEILIKANIGGDGTNRAITLFGTSGVGYGKNLVTFDNVLRTDTAVSAWLAIYAQAFKNFAFFRCQYYLYNNSVGQNTPMFNASNLAFLDQTTGNFIGENFPCINIGCWKAGKSGVIKAGTRIEILGR